MTPAAAAQYPAPPSLSLGDWLTDLLKQRIAAGGYQPGEWIREPALQKEFGLSNGPVREALQNLVGAGVLTRVARRGVRVVELSDEEIVELFQMRLALLELAAELAASRARPQDLNQATALAAEIDQAIRRQNLEALILAGGALVDEVCRIADNRQITTAWEGLTLKSRVYIHASLSACSDLGSIGPLWRALPEAIKTGDRQAARQAARAMVRRMLDDLGLNGNF